MRLNPHYNWFITGYVRKPNFPIDGTRKRGDGQSGSHWGGCFRNGGHPAARRPWHGLEAVESGALGWYFRYTLPGTDRVRSTRRVRGAPLSEPTHTPSWWVP